MEMMSLRSFQIIKCRSSKCPPAVLVLILAFVTRTESTCNEEQIEACREAAVAGRLEGLRSSGECLAKQYMEFSHLCSVSNYLPTVEYCCCRHLRDSLLCCRYHQDWNRFRCQEADDIIMTRGMGAKGALVDLPPLEILLPSTLVPLTVILVGCCLCVVLCCCWRRRRQRLRKMNDANDDDARHDECLDGFCHECITCRCSESRKTKRVSQRHPSSEGEEEDDRVRPLSAASQDDETAAAAVTTPLDRHPVDDRLQQPLSVSQLLPYDPSFVPCSRSDDRRGRCHCSHRLPFYSPDPPPPSGARSAPVEPSAPPAADVIPFAGVPYSRTHGALTSSYSINDQCACANHHCIESHDENVSRETGGGRGVSITFCPHCFHLQPPPPYDESLTHRVVCQ